jgi:DNA-binding transcriptional regulator GbsR (MarR family)
MSTPAKRRFVESWGEMGSAWGINKTMARLHAYLMVAEEPVDTDELMKALSISRGNANMNIRALIDWGLVRRVSHPGERKEFFQSEKDVWTMCCRIARERKKREIEPVLATLDELLLDAGSDKEFKKKLKELQELVRMLDTLLGKVAGMERSKVLMLARALL